jgi:hypothetical protein
MGPPSYMRSVVDWNVIMRRIREILWQRTYDFQPHIYEDATPLIGQTPPATAFSNCGKRNVTSQNKIDVFMSHFRHDIAAHVFWNKQ